MSWLSSFFNKVTGNKVDKAYRDQENAGKVDEKFGLDLTNEGLGGLRDLGAGYQKELAAGGLPEDLRRQFRVLRGSLGDNAVRMNRAYLAKLNQRLLTSPTFRPEAASEFDLENQQNIGESLFEATNKANMQEAGLALDNTNSLRDRLDRIRMTILGVGQDERQRALQRILGSIGGRSNSDSSLRSFWSSLIPKPSGASSGSGGID